MLAPGPWRPARSASTASGQAPGRAMCALRSLRRTYRSWRWEIEDSDTSWERRSFIASLLERTCSAPRVGELPRMRAGRLHSTFLFMSRELIAINRSIIREMRVAMLYWRRRESFMPSVVVMEVERRFARQVAWSRHVMTPCGPSMLPTSCVS